MASLMDRLHKASTVKGATKLSDSKVFTDKDMTPTDIPGLNIALSGKLDEGFGPGMIQWCGPSKHFKSLFTLLCAGPYMRKYEDAVMIFIDSEFGMPQAYFDFCGIDTDRVLHVPVTNIEELKHETMTQLQEIARGDHVIFVIDSVGNLASKKEVDDALAGSEKADMTRAKQLKSFGRMVTPHLTLKNITMFIVNHIYMEMTMFPKAIVSGGTGLYLSSDEIFIVGRRQDKNQTTKEIYGYDFIINIEKSRHVKEKSAVPISVEYEGGVAKWSGLTDLAVEAGFLGKPKKGYFQRLDENGEFVGEQYKERELKKADDFWNDLIETTNFNEFIRKKYRLGANESNPSEKLDESFEESLIEGE